MGISPLYLWNVRNIITSSAGLTQVNRIQAFLSFCRFMLRKDWAFVWYVCTEYHVWNPILYWFHKSLALWPRVSTSTLPTWPVVIWHSLRKSGAVCSRGFSFISSDDIKFYSKSTAENVPLNLLKNLFLRKFDLGMLVRFSTGFLKSSERKKSLSNETVLPRKSSYSRTSSPCLLCHHKCLI